MGGLGNQMFQISKALSEGYKNNIEVKFLRSAFIPMEGNQPRKYEKNIFRNIKFVDNLEHRTRVPEPDWSYNDINVNYTNSVEFYGYFQSSKNFKNYRDKIISCFEPTDDFIDKIKNKYPGIFQKNSVSIHIRRGDYLTIPDVLPTIDKTYIDECLKHLENYTSIFIFSNDKEWCKNNLDYTNSLLVDGLEDYEELWAMSLCNHNIMSNSSFSWWGSYLNKNEDKRVIVPSIWFGPKGEKNFVDVYEPEWEKINVIYSNGKLIYDKI